MEREKRCTSMGKVLMGVFMVYRRVVHGRVHGHTAVWGQGHEAVHVNVSGTCMRRTGECMN